MKTKALVFDAYGTLFDVNSAAEKCKDKIGTKWEAFANFWRTTQLEYTWLRSLMKRHKNFWEVTEDSLDKSMRVFNIDKGMKSELLNLYKILSPYPEVQGVLEDLKKQPNSNSSHQQEENLKTGNEKEKSISAKKTNWVNYTTQINHLYLRMICERSTSLNFDIQIKDEEIRDLTWQQLIELKVVLEKYMNYPSTWTKNFYTKEFF